MMTVSNRLIAIGVCAAVLVLSAGCGRDKRPEYLVSEELEPIRVPSDLTPPDTSRALDLPGEFPAELAGTRDDERPPRVLPSDEARMATSRIRSGPHGLQLEVDDGVDSVFHRIGVALSGSDMNVLKMLPDQRVYRFRFTDTPEIARRRGMRRLAFWRRAEVYDYSGEYRLRLEADGRRTRVHIFDGNGGVADADAAEAVLEELKDRLG